MLIYYLKLEIKVFLTISRREFVDTDLGFAIYLIFIKHLSVVELCF